MVKAGGEKDAFRQIGTPAVTSACDLQLLTARIARGGGGVLWRTDKRNPQGLWTGSDLVARRGRNGTKRHSECEAVRVHSGTVKMKNNFPRLAMVGALPLPSGVKLPG